MDINLPPRVRQVIYIVTSLGSILVAYLSAAHVISPEAVAALIGVNTFVAGLAAYNVTKGL